VSRAKEKFVPEKISRHKKNDKKETNEFLSWIYSLLIAVTIALCLRFFVFDFVVVEGDSMNPTLDSGQIMFVEKISYKFNQPSKGDIVISRYNDENKNYVKRAIANAGDEIRIESGEVFVNDMQLIEPYILEDMVGQMAPTEVASSTVFLMGDNRNNSLDSRMVGSIDLDIVRGKAVFVVWPFDKFGKIEG
jgi:signal peptidase I